MPAIERIAIEYVDHMGNDLRVKNAAYASFARGCPEDVPVTEKDKGLLKYLATGLPASERDDWENRANASSHWTPFAHCVLSIRCAAPIFLARQLGKHQIGLTWSEESRRYIDTPVSIWLPDEVREKPANAKQGSGGVHPETVALREAMYQSGSVAVAEYERLLALGVAPEEARIVLPQNAVTHWMWTGSLVAFLRVIKQRADGHAQTAARDFAVQLEAIVIERFPFSVEAFK